MEVVYVATAAYLDKLGWLDKHILGGYDICNRRCAGIVVCYPDRDRDVVGGAAKEHREKAVYTQEKLCAPVVVRWR